MITLVGECGTDRVDMERSPSQDLGLADTHDTLSTLEHIVHFLHTEGFYAAEEALLREIENRYPEGDEILHGEDSSAIEPAVDDDAHEVPSSPVFAPADSTDHNSRFGD